MKFLSFSLSSLALFAYLFFNIHLAEADVFHFTKKVETDHAFCDCVIDAGEDYLIALGDSIKLEVVASCQAFQIENIEWNNAESLSCSDCLEPYARPLEDICYTISITWDDGCTSMDEICVSVKSCDPEYVENVINGVTPQPIVDQAEIELELIQTQYVHIEIVDNNTVLYPIWEGWLKSGLQTQTLDFSSVPSGNHDLRVRLFPENQTISIQKQ